MMKLFNLKSVFRVTLLAAFGLAVSSSAAIAQVDFADELPHEHMEHGEGEGSHDMMMMHMDETIQWMEEMSDEEWMENREDIISELEDMMMHMEDMHHDMEMHEDMEHDEHMEHDDMDPMEGGGVR